MTIDHTGGTVAVTGAASGIGRAIAEAFLQSGANVLMLDREEKAEELTSYETNDRVKIAFCDIASYETLQSAAAIGPVDHLVCSAAIGSGKFGFPFWNLEPSHWSKVLEVTLMGTVNTIHAFTPALMKSQSANRTITVLGSVAGQIGSQTDPPYSAAKAALINFAQCAAKDLAGEGIRVNTLSPGMVKTPLNRSVFESSEESGSKSYEEWAEEKIKKVAPLGRWQEPEEFAAMAVFLASDHAKNITGQTLNIDGGQVMHS